MAAALAQRATSSRPQIKLCAQILLMPIVDLTPTDDPSTWSPSMRENANVLELYARDVIWSRNLHTPKSSDRTLPDASPLFQENNEAFEGVPRAWVGIAELGVLRSGGERYAEKLQKHGVPVELKTYYKATHLLIQADGVCELARTIRDDQIKALKAAFS
ncbi:alpha/beta hydrolase family protein [Ceratobasidium sp. AG-Ba]|nr:alpha/beta hydrolase family protein [Ceratobasidium sp. AG-Ba]